MDFTHEKYLQLIKALIDAKYSFQTYEEFINKPLNRTIILRHDVDKYPNHSMCFARIQAELGIKRKVYYFRAVPCSWDEKIILEISSLGHEVGYHYENLTSVKGILIKL